MPSKTGFTFTRSQFFRDIATTAEAIGAEYSSSTTKMVLEAYMDSFRDSAVLWRTTDRPGGALNYRFYERRPRDTVAVAVKAGLLAADGDTTRLISSWSSLYRGVSTELCDFDAANGLAKTWVFLGGVRPVDEVLRAQVVPETIRRHAPAFHDLGLVGVRHVAVDHQHGTANLYFRVFDPMTESHAQRLMSLVGGGVIPRSTYDDLTRFTSPKGYTFSVTMTPADGEIERIGFYALRLPAGQFPAINDRLATFFRAAPSYDEEEMNAVAWSFGPLGKKYVKAERSYCGRLVSLMQEWGSPMTTVGQDA
ncbi:aromatic prenyltransferase [Kutzneria sp. NPDC051319]|uniref:aromatic prenyltransferase n=1 Tax=Kutzneria sp. NPDC051319 TaxID=3155047 RepID=UPI0034351D68